MSNAIQPADLGFFSALAGAGSLSAAARELGGSTPAGSKHLAAMEADGQLRDGDPDVLAVVVLAQVHGLAGLAAGGMLNGVPAATLISTALDVLWTGLSGPISGG